MTGASLPRPDNPGSSRRRGPVGYAVPPAPELRHLYVDEGLSVAAVGANFGVSKRTARRWLEAAGIDRRPGWQAPPPVPRPGELRRCVDAGLSTAQIAAKFGTTRQRARQWILDAGLAQPQRREPTPAAKELRRLYVDERLSVGAVGAKFGVSKRTARRWLEAAGIDRRPSDRAIPAPAPHELQAMLADDISVAAIAERHAVSARTVRRWLHAAGLRTPTPGRKRTQAPARALLVSLYVDERLGSPQIAARFGVSKRTVLDWLRNAGIEVRPRSEVARRPKIPPPADLAVTAPTRTAAELQQYYGVGDRTVRRWLQETAITPRRRGRAVPAQTKPTRSPT